MSGLQDAVDGVLARYAMAIDDDRLEDWLELFAEDCRYRIAARDNVEAGLPVSVVYADGRAMLSDRVAALRRANVYEAQRYRHVVGRALVEAGPPVAARAGYHVARIMREGDLMLFSTGEYRAVFDADLSIREMTVVYDNARIDTLLALPL